MRILFILSAVILCFSCTEKKTLTIDNPTRKEIQVKFEEGLERSVPAKSQERIIITKPSTTVYLNGEKVGDITFDGDDEYILNPTLSNYYIEEVAYGGGMHSKPKGNKNDITEQTLKFDDIPYTGYVRKDNSLLIAKVWKYGVDNELPLAKEGQSPSIKRKIYREIDFERYAKKTYFDALRAKQK